MSGPRSPPGPEPRFSAGDEAFEKLFFSHPWERTRLGPTERWPRRLLGYVTMILKWPTPAIIFWGPDQLQLYNAGYAAIMGPRHPEYLGRTYAECWPETYPTIHPWMQRVLRGEVLEVVNAPIALARHGFDEEAYFTFSFSPLRDDSGQIAGILQPVVEKTAEVLAQRRVATLRELAAEVVSPGRVAEVLDCNPLDIPFSLLYLRTEPDQDLVLVSQSALAGAPSGVPAAVRRTFASNTVAVVDAEEILGPPGGASTQTASRKAALLPVRRIAGEAPRGVIVLGASPRLPFDDAYRAFFEGAAGEISAGLAAGQEQMMRADAERERQNLYDFFMQTPAPLCIVLGPEHRFALANPSYVEFVGREVVGKTVSEAFGPETTTAFLPLLDRVYATGDPFVGKEVPVRLSSDEEALVNMSFVPLRSSDGATKGILVFAYDITAEVNARKQSESLAKELQSAVRARDEFLGIASHELKTPLTSLLLQIQMMQRGLVTVDADKLVKQAHRLSRLVDDMLDISRINAGKLALEKTQVDLSALVNDVLDRFEPQLVSVGSRIVRRLGAGVVGSWDAYRLEQVLTNLITNALKYAPGKPVTVTTRRHDARAVIAVADEGSGVAPSDRQRIFQQFERATSANEVSGLGLGLYISKQIVEAHRGSIHVEANQAGGAEFVVELPLS
jgi:PAS domain S-box-containing protein